MQQQLIGFYNRDGEYLLRGTKSRVGPGSIPRQSVSDFWWSGAGTGSSSYTSVFLRQYRSNDALYQADKRAKPGSLPKKQWLIH